METEEEKVLPFYSSSLSTEEEEKASGAEAIPPSEPLAKVRDKKVLMLGYDPINLLLLL